MTKFKMFLIGVSIVVIIGFFLPWARPLATLKDNKIKIPTSEPSFVWDFLLMQERDRNDSFLSEPEGISAYQMVASVEKESRIGKLTHIITQHFWNSSPDWRVKLLILFPLLALISLFCFLREETPVVISMSLAFLQVILYAAVRWQLNAGYLMHLEMALAPGLWLTIYGSVLLALGNLGMCIRK